MAEKVDDQIGAKVVEKVAVKIKEKMVQTSE